MTETLELPTIDPSALDATALPEKTDVAVTSSAAVDLTKVDLQAVALAHFTKSRADVAEAKKKLTGVVHDLSTPGKLAEAKSLRQRLINTPLADTRKVSEALKSKLTAVSKAVGVELVALETEFKEANALITPQIDARETALANEKAERDRIEAERKAKHEAGIATLAGYVEHAKGLSSERIAKGIEVVQAFAIDRASWEEFADRAEEQKAVTIERLQAMLAAALQAESAAAEAERVRIENEARARTIQQLATIGAQVSACIGKTAADIGATLNLLRSTTYPEGTADEVLTAFEAAKVQVAALLASAVRQELQDAEIARLKASANPPAAAPEPVAAPAPAPAAPVKRAFVAAPAAKHADDESTMPSSARSEAAIDLALSQPGAVEAVASLVVGALEATQTTGYAITASPAFLRGELNGPTAAQLLAVLKHAASAFAGKFPTHPKPSAAWWDELRILIQAAAPDLIASQAREAAEVE